MAHLKLLLALTSALVFAGTISAQDFASGGDIVSGIGSALQSLMSTKTSRLQQVVAALSDPGALLAGGGGPGAQEALEVLDRLRQVGPDCLAHMGMFVEAVTQRQEWAIRMLDAVGKPPSGLLNFKLLWLGDWDECTSTVAPVYPAATSEPTTAFRGQYCPVSFPLPVPGAFGAEAKLTIGTCFPDSCSASDVTTLLNLTLSYLSTNFTIPEPEVSCQENSIELDTFGIVGLTVLFVFLAIITIATLYDVVYIHWLAKPSTDQPPPYMTAVELQQGGKQSNGHVLAMDNAAFQGTHDEKSGYAPTSNGTVKDANTEKSDFAAIDSAQLNMKQSNTPDRETAGQKYKPTTLESILLSFSAFTNGTKILNTHQPAGALTAVNGIRFLSMAWVICGHGFAWVAGSNADNTVQYISSLAKRREFTPIINGTFSVDTFFVLSGALVSYLSLKQLKKVRGMKHFNWGMYYFHRFWRLSPPYFMLFLLYVSLDKYLANGPMWPQEGFERDTCRQSWWTNILYINNLVKEGRMLGCFGWTWYLANDMQFYIISPLILILLYYVPILGGLSCLGVVAGSAISSVLISMYYELPSSTIFHQEKNYAYMWYYYVKPWCRVGPYAIGLFTGYLLYKSQLKAKINRVVNVLAWLVAIGLGCLIIYCLYAPDFQNPLTTKQAAIYNAMARNVWGAAIAWMIYACANGYGGPIHHLLSWPGFVPLGRLTYFAYLVHPMVMTVKRVSMLNNFVLYDYGVVYILLGHFCMAYSLAFVLSLMFEAPMMGLEKVLLGRAKSS